MGSIVQGSLTASICAPTISALANLGATALSLPTLAHVLTVDSLWLLQPSSLPVDGITIIDARGKAGYQWVRLSVANRTFQAQLAWFVDPANSSGLASDENNGLGKTTPLKTYAELARRIDGALYVGSTQNVSITSMSSCSANDVFRPNIICRPDVATGTLAAMWIFGMPEIIYTGSITGSVSNVNVGSYPTVNDQSFADSAIPVSWAPFVGKLWQRADGTRAYSWIVKDKGSKIARSTIPVNTQDAVGSFGGVTVRAMSVAQTYNILSLPDLPAIEPINGNVNSQIIVQYCNIIDSSIGLDWTSMPNVTYRLCSIAGGFFGCAQNLANCLITSAGSVGVGGEFNVALSSGGGVLGTGADFIFVTNNGRVSGNVEIPYVLQGAGITCVHGGRYEGASLLQYDASVATLSVNFGGWASLAGQGGSNNTGKIVAVGGPGDMVIVTASTYTAGSTSDADPFSTPSASYPTPAAASAEFATKGWGIMPV